MSSRCFVIAISLLCVHVTLVIGVSSCKWSTTTPIKASFDFSSIVSPDPQGYVKEDDVDDFRQNYLYYFNLCNSVLKPPNVPDSVSCSSGNVTAYQITNITSGTGRLGVSSCRSLGTQQSLSWKLIESDNEGITVQQNYSGGDGGRFFVISFQCNKRASINLNKSVVAELNTKQYYLTLNTLSACPLECPIVNGLPCGENGMCGVDHDLQTIRCFCNAGKEGTTCQDDIQQATKSHANGVLMAFVLILLILLLILAGILYKKIKKLNSDATRYQSLQANDDNNKQPSSLSNVNVNTVTDIDHNVSSINQAPADVDD